MDQSIFSEISIIVAIGAGVAGIMYALRQPLIISYLVTGILVGPSVLNIVKSRDTVETFANIGIVLLLFIVGLGLNPRFIKEIGKAAILTGVGQVVITIGIGYLIVRSFVDQDVEAIYIATALAFSSTIIVLKLLNDKKEQNRLYGKITIGFLLIQDVLATIALLISAASGNGGLTKNDLLFLGFKGLILTVFLVSASIRVLPPVLSFVSKSQEFLFLFSISWGLGIAALTAKLGFSLEVGALFAGVTLASLPYAREMASRLRPLRDFFIVLFFISLGAHLGIDNIGSILPLAILLSAFVLIGNPLMVMLIMGMLGYTKKTSFKTGIAIAQISEFSLILVILGNRHNQVSDETVALVTIAALITIAISTYMIIYSEKLYQIFERYLQLFERKKVRFEQSPHGKYKMILFGYKKGGTEFVKLFKSLDQKFVVVDYDPDVIDQLEHLGYNHIFGDVADIELLDEIGVDESHVVASVITDFQASKFMAEYIRGINPNAVIICRAENVKEARELYSLGASYVMLPHYLGAEKVMSFVKRNGFKKSEFKKLREKHLQYLETRAVELGLK